MSRIECSWFVSLCNGRSFHSRLLIWSAVPAVITLRQCLIQSIRIALFGSVIHHRRRDLKKKVNPVVGRRR